MRASQYLDALRQAHGLTSDQAVAKLLNLTQQQASKYRKNRDHFSDETALHVAQLLNLDPLQVVADAQSHRATTEGTRSFWRKLADLSRKLPASAALLSCVAAVLPEATTPGASASPVYYVNKARRWLATVLLPRQPEP